MIPLELLKNVNLDVSAVFIWRNKSHFSNDDFDFPIFGGLICFSKNIIYIIECKACGNKYIGETGRCLKDRIFNHILNQ